MGGFTPTPSTGCDYHQYITRNKKLTKAAVYEMSGMQYVSITVDTGSINTLYNGLLLFLPHPSWCRRKLITYNSDIYAPQAPFQNNCICSTDVSFMSSGITTFLVQRNPSYKLFSEYKNWYRHFCYKKVEKCYRPYASRAIIKGDNKRSVVLITKQNA